MTDLLKQYNYNQYLDFSKHVQTILHNALKEKVGEYSLHGITFRAKDPKSLEKKIEKNDINDLSTIKDLAGCRIIFFYNSDVRKFTASNIIRDNFEIIEGPIFHNRIQDISEDPNSFYTALHYLVQLKKSDGLSSRYSYEGLKCEIQIHTYLNHAYSETSHDITYKRPNDLIIGKNALSQIDRNLALLACRYLIPAGYFLDKIIKNKEDILEANKIAKNIISHIQNASSALELSNILDEWRDKASRFYDNRDSLQDQEVNIVNLTMNKWEDFKDDPNADELLMTIIKILVYLMPLKCELFFYKIVDLYQYSLGKTILGKINKHIRHITKYNKRYVENGDYKQQATVLAIMNTWHDECLIKMFDFICLLSQEILRLHTLECNSKTDKNYQEPGKTSASMIFYDMPVLAGKVKDLRSVAILLLIKLYSINRITELQKQQLIAVLSKLGKPYFNTDYTISLSEAVISHFIEIVRFYIKILPMESYFLCDLIYRQVFKFRQLAWKVEQQEDIKNIVKEFLDLTDAFKNKLHAKEDFTIYHDLFWLGTVNYVGDCWDNKAASVIAGCTDHEKYIAIIQNYVEAINPITDKKWEGIILNCVRTKNGSNCRLAEFFYELGKKKPLFLINILNKYEAELIDYLSYIFSGLLSSQEAQQAKNLLHAFIDQNKYLESLVKIYRLESSELKLIAEKAKSEKNFRLLTQMLKNPYDKEANKPLILPIIEELTKAEIALDSGMLSYVINDLGEYYYEKILDNLLYLQELEEGYVYYIEKIAAKNPSIIMAFFQKLSDKDIDICDFEEAWSIGECLVQSINNLDYYTDLTPKLFSFLFSIKNQEVLNLLYNLTNNEEKIAYIVELLDYYNRRGIEANHNIKEILSIINSLLINHELNNVVIRNLIRIIIFESKAVYGCYGSSKALKFRQKTIEELGYSKSTNLKLKKFAQDINKKLDQAIKSIRSDEEPSALKII